MQIKSRVKLVTFGVCCRHRDVAKIAVFVIEPRRAVHLLVRRLVWCWDGSLAWYLQYHPVHGKHTTTLMVRSMRSDELEMIYGRPFLLLHILRLPGIAIIARLRLSIMFRRGRCRLSLPGVLSPVVSPRFPLSPRHRVIRSSDCTGHQQRAHSTACMKTLRLSSIADHSREIVVNIPAKPPDHSLGVAKHLPPRSLHGGKLHPMVVGLLRSKIYCCRS